MHPDVVTVEPLYENDILCSQKAVLFAESTQPIRLSSIILAREIGMLKENTVCNSKIIVTSCSVTFFVVVFFVVFLYVQHLAWYLVQEGKNYLSELA